MEIEKLKKSLKKEIEESIDNEMSVVMRGIKHNLDNMIVYNNEMREVAFNKLRQHESEIKQLKQGIASLQINFLDLIAILNDSARAGD